MTGRLSAGFGDFTGRTWLNTAHQGAMPIDAAEAARETVSWKLDPRELTVERFEGVPQRLRGALSRLVNGRPDDIVLGNSASYGLHLVANAFPWAAGDEVLVVEGDFPSNILPWLILQGRFGVRVHRIRPRRRVVSAGELAAAITPRTRLFCTSWVHSFSGHVADLDGLGEICRQRGVFFVANGSQALGARPIDVGNTPVDALVCAGFKWLCGPYGTGFVWIRPELRDRLTRIKAYWLAQLAQRDLARDDLEVTLDDARSTGDLDIFGTANFNNYAPWTVAIEHLLDIGIRSIYAHDDALVAHLVEGLSGARVELLSPREPDARSTLVFFSHRDRGRNAELHRTLATAGVDLAFRGGSLRAAPHLYNTRTDVDKLLSIID